MTCIVDESLEYSKPDRTRVIEGIPDVFAHLRHYQLA